MTRYFLGRDGGMPTPVPDDEPGDRAETLANSAFYTEVQVVPLDAVVAGPDDIVIRRGELPEVRTGQGSSGVYYRANAGYGSALNPSGVVKDILGLAEIRAREFLALAEYLREHPPVDEEQVKALTAIVGETHMSWDSERMARFLVERGVRVGGESR